MNSFRLSLLSGLLIGVLLFVASAPPRALADKIAHQSAVAEAALPQYIVAAVNAPERPAADKERDATRHPEQTMAFFGIKPGMQVADLWAAGGYTTELLARIVGPTGKVYSQNIEFPEKFKSAEETWHKRTSELGLSNVVEVIKPFDAPDVLPVAPGTLDAVLINLNYHDLVARNFDRAKLNAAVFKALKPGGIYGTVDNSAQAGGLPGWFRCVRSVPSASAPSAIASKTPAVAPATDQISARLERIQEALKTPRADEAMVSRIATVEGQTKALGDQLRH